MRILVAECRPGNVASWELLRKLGFRDTGEEGHRPGRRLLHLRDERALPNAKRPEP